MTPFLNFSSAAGNDVVRVEKLSIIETGTYQTQFIVQSDWRSWTLQQTKRLMPLPVKVLT